MSMLPTPHDNLTCPYRERAEKAERDLCESQAILTAAAHVLVGDEVSDFEQSFPSVRGVLNLREELAEAREDIKALAMVLRFHVGPMPLVACPGCDGSGTISRELPGDAECPYGCRGEDLARNPSWQRIRDRKLLEVSDGE